MRRYVQGLLLLGLAALPSPAQAQYGSPGYYYPQPMPVYAPAYPYAGQGMPAPYYRPYPQAQWAQPIYYYTAPAPVPYRMAVRPVNPVSYPAAAPRTRTVSRPARAPMPVGDPVEEEGDTAVDSQPEPVTPPKAPAKAAAPPKTVAPVLPPAAADAKLPADPHHPAVLEDPHPQDPNCPAGRRQRFLGFAEGLYWNVHSSGVPFAQAFDGVDPFLSVPRGPVGVADLGYNYGYRAGAGVSLTAHTWLTGTFTYFQDNTQAHLEAPDGNVLHSNVIFPNTANAAFAPLVADADYNVRLFTGDLDFKRSIVENDCLQLNWLAGVRFGRITQAFSAQYEEILGIDTVRTRVSFNGIGPRAGLEGEYKVKWGLFGYGKGILDVLAGRFGGSFEQRDIFGGLVALSSIDEKRIVPVTEFELGAGWASPKGMVRVSSGYYVGSWFNTLTTQGLIRGIQANDFTTNGDNFRDVLSFDGLVGRIEIRY